MRFLLLLFTSILFVSVHAQIVNIPDANFKAYLIGNSEINLNGDSEIQVSEAEAFTGAVFAQTRKIADLTGIESFINITRLECGSNNITSLDISKNTELTNLNCGKNLLTSLNVTKNTKLTNLNFGSNQITRIDLSNNIHLEVLLSNANSLESLDVSKNTKLITLATQENRIRVLDVSNNSELKYLYINSNLIRKINLELNTKLNIINCDYCPLKRLDLSNNSELTYFTCRYMPLLEEIDLRNGNNIKIKTFTAIYNPILRCIAVDNPEWAKLNWKSIDASTEFGCGSQVAGISIIDENCNVEGSEKGLKNVMIQTDVGPYYSSTGKDGSYKFWLDSGNYRINQVLPLSKARLINQNCPGSNGYLIALDSIQIDTTGFNFHNEVTECPYLELDISSTRRRRCFENKTYLSYKNDGFADAQEAKVFLKLPEHVHLLKADHSYVLNEDSIYVFDIGELKQGESGRIIITDSVACELGITGLTQCTEAWITPVNNCVHELDTEATTEWDKSSMKVEGECAGNSAVRFTISNTGELGGGDMQSASEYRIYADNELVYTSTFQLVGYEELVVEFPANGQTFRLEADQHPKHPGRSRPRETIEACGSGGEPVSLGFVNQAPMDDLDPEVEIDCLPIIDSYDPNDKVVSPTGITAENNVYPATLLDYRIRFQNTGTDTAYTVVIVDTLSTTLDLSTIQWGSSSHPYTLEVSGKGAPVLTFTFNDIDLPDSTTNELESQGYIKFKVAPYDTLSVGTVIDNAADIYFDYNLPIRTNTAFVTISEDFPIAASELKVEVSKQIITSVNGFSQEIGSVAPNPFNETLNVTFTSSTQRELQLIDMTGRVVARYSVTGQEVELATSQVEKGVYLLRVESSEGVETQKLVKQ